MALPTGVQSAGGALNVTYNDTTSKGAYMPDGSLRVTDVPGTGLYDASGALRVVDITGKGVYQSNGAAIRISDADDDGKTGVQYLDGSIRMSDVLEVAAATYVAEDGVTVYVTENGANNYIAG